MRYSSLLLTILLIGFGCAQQESTKIPDGSDYQVTQPTSKPQTQTREDRVEFAHFNPVYRFSGVLPEGFSVLYVPEIESMAIADPKLQQKDALDEAQIFIRYFNANQFLTLSTVTIHKKESTKINTHDAVFYDIEKKPGVKDFPSQPNWRNKRHEVTDIRFSAQSPTSFFVFARNPEFDKEKFENFLNSLKFHNDKVSFEEPIENSRKRITKKPFGIFVTPENSPVNPERFSGFHTGVDYEIFDDEKNKPILVSAICGGPIKETRIADGYGGIVVQNCSLESENITVVYGHIDIKSVQYELGKYPTPGDVIAELGDGFSEETDNERKHLHLSIYRGSSTDIRGYVSQESELNSWIDPEELLR